MPTTIAEVVKIARRRARRNREPAHRERPALRHQRDLGARAAVFAGKHHRQQASAEHAVDERGVNELDRRAPTTPTAPPEQAARVLHGVDPQHALAAVAAIDEWSDANVELNVEPRRATPGPASASTSDTRSRPPSSAHPRAHLGAEDRRVVHHRERRRPGPGTARASITNPPSASNSKRVSTPASAFHA